MESSFLVFHLRFLFLSFLGLFLNLSFLLSFFWCTRFLLFHFLCRDESTAPSSSPLALHLTPYGIPLPLVAFYDVIWKQWSLYYFLFYVSTFLSSIVTLASSFATEYIISNSGLSVCLFLFLTWVGIPPMAAHPSWCWLYNLNMFFIYGGFYYKNRWWI